MPKELSPLQRKFWQKKLDIARQNHAAERVRGGEPGGISMNRLAAYVRDAERAQRKLGDHDA